MRAPRQDVGVEAHHDGAVPRGEVGATVPDIKFVLERDTGRPVTTEGLRYDYRVRVFGIPTPEIMRTDDALSIWGT